MVALRAKAVAVVELLTDNGTPRLSVIIPVLDDIPSLMELLQQLAPLRREGHEVIVVDGGSRDPAAGDIRGRCEVYAVTHAGRANQMNVGAARASGDVLWFLHADSVISDDTAELLERAVDSGSRWGWCRIQLSGSARIYRVIEFAMDLRSRVSRVSTGDQGLYVESSLFDQVGGFPEVPLMEDVAICKRLRKRASPVLVPSFLITSSRRWETQGVLRTIGLMWGLRLLYWFGVSSEVLARCYYAGYRSTDSHSKH
ncbi:MAG TPA: glycosyltransferase [Chromatiales bacterium]|jgi:rSAM/selenodomain-associated transferase 2|nr:glycosyltransferase [Chromatiaceae bacterium]HIB84492.1 glycosyltransferase [Chromatiaceae bacterium]HIN81536.1 glycosyltransferase [Chromatiales bacterium]HIO14676.1 glycosyltransferase [Chromatiales bacterium]HIO53774.1 glycosyltransferase [Chromatiales bacterium]